MNARNPSFSECSIVGHQVAVLTRDSVATKRKRGGGTQSQLLNFNFKSLSRDAVSAKRGGDNDSGNANADDRGEHAPGRPLPEAAETT